MRLLGSRTSTQCRGLSGGVDVSRGHSSIGAVSHDLRDDVDPGNRTSPDVSFPTGQTWPEKAP